MFLYTTLYDVEIGVNVAFNSSTSARCNRASVAALVGVEDDDFLKITIRKVLSYFGECCTCKGAYCLCYLCAVGVNGCVRVIFNTRQKNLAIAMRSAIYVNAIASDPKWIVTGKHSPK